MKKYGIKAQIDLPNQVVLKVGETITEAEIKAHNLPPATLEALVANGFLVEEQATKTAG